jgi:exopolysaccharide biosynthesis polyprenyl glycosylphosphotransferase
MEPGRGIDVAPMGGAEAAVAPSSAPSTHLLPVEVGAAARRRFGARVGWGLACLGVDVGTLGAAAAGSMVGARQGGFDWSFDGWTIAFAALTLLMFQARGLYRLRIKIPVADDVRRILTALTLAATAIVTIRLLISSSPSMAAETIRPWAFAAVYVSAGRVALYWSQTKSRVAGDGARATLVVGAGRVGRTIAARLSASPQLGLKPIGFLDAEPLADEEQLGFPLLGESWDDLERLVKIFGIEHVIVTFSTSRDEVLLALVNRAEALGLGVSIVPRLYEKVPDRISVDHLGGLPLMTAYAANPRGFEIAVKYAIDRLVGTVMFFLLSPIFAVAALGVFLSMGRPLFFRQVRVGRDGRTFEILKFRSMKLPTPEELEAQARAIAEGLPGGVEGVDRRTKVGTILRKTSIDELPQLLNVVRGEMSLVGPRPERPEFVSKFEDSVYRYTDRHRVKSGMTGWAQVHGLRGKTSIEDRAEWDNYYIENFSLWLDVKILFMTVGAVLRALKEVE